MKKSCARTYSYDQKNTTLRPYSIHFAKKLQELRKRRRLYQFQLSENVGISQSHISNYESGWANPSLYHLVLLSNFFEVCLTEFIINKNARKIEQRPFCSMQKIIKKRL